MKELPFVGRIEAQQKLINLLRQGATGQGSIIFIEGNAGMGKTQLLRALQDKAKLDDELVDTTFVWGHCYQDIGSQNAYQPFVDMLEDLSGQDDKRNNISKLISKIIKDTAPDWFQAIPVFGPLIGAGLKTAAITREWLIKTDGDQLASRSGEMIKQYSKTISLIASDQVLLVLLIEDAHWIDHASCQLILSLTRQFSEQKLVIIVTYRPNYLQGQHPLRQVQQEILIKNWGHKMVLTGLTKDEIQQYIYRRFKTPLDPNMAAWLEHLCKGIPLFVTEYLSLLEQENIVQRKNGEYVLNGHIRYTHGNWKPGGLLSTLAVPESIEALLNQRIHRLAEEEQEMLNIGAVQGEQFMSTILATLLKIDQIDALSQLRKISERHRIISLCTEHEWTENRSDVYTFEHFLMHQAFYNKLSPGEKVMYHQEIAEILESNLRNQRTASRKLVLEIAYHNNLGGKLLPAARYYYLAAKSSFSDGAFRETIQLCQKVLEIMRMLPEGDREGDQIHAETVLLLAICAIDGEGDREEQLNLLTLTNEGEAAASRADDLTILAHIKSIRGNIFVHIGNVPDALKEMKEALEIAKLAKDPLTEAVALRNLGAHLVKEDLEAGIELRYQAYEIYQTHFKTAQTNRQSITLEREFNILLGSLCISEFDRGYYGTALDQAMTAFAELKRLKMQDDLIWVSNYLGQIYMAVGLFEEAETVLREAIELRKDKEIPHSWNGYNLALLGKLYLEWQRVDEALVPLLKGWRESEVTQQADLFSIVRNYYAELLMHPNYENRSLAEAEKQLALNIKETKAAGLIRSTVTALSLRSQIALEQTRIEDAVNYSTQAITHLQEMGTLPAVRMEEVLFIHYRVLKSAGNEDEAQKYLDQAHQVLLQKANSIVREEHRRAFLERVPLSMEIRFSIRGDVR